MKKTILASAILLAGAANAAEIYNNEGTTVSLGGSFRGHVAIENKDNIKFEDAGTRFDLKASKELDNGLKAFGKAEIKRNSKDDSLYFNKSYVGLAHDVYGTLTLGKQMGLNDDLVMNDFSYEAGVYRNEDNAKFGSDAEDQLKYVKAFGGASVVISAMDKHTYAIGGTYEVAGLELGASYNIANDRVVDEKVSKTVKSDNSTYILGARYTIDSLVVGGQYQANKVGKHGTVGKNKNSAYGLGAKYTLGQASVYTSYDILTGDVKSDKGSEIVLGTDYTLADGVVAYTEFTASKRDAASTDHVKGTDNKVVIGGRVYF